MWYIFISATKPAEIVQNYTYLGTLISSTGNFSLALYKLKEKALHALFSLSLLRFVCFLSPYLANKISDAMISPILSYNSDVGSAYTKSDLKSWGSSQIEKTHLQFCKRYLEVSNKASNVALCRAELDRFPFIIAINQKIMNYYSYLLSRDNKSFLCRKIFITLVKIVIIQINNFPCVDVTYLN